MLKFLGSLFIVSSMTGIGIWKAEEVKHSYQALGKIYHLIGMMKNELSYAGSEFGEMFECLSKKVDAPYRNWLLGMKIQMERRDGKTFSEIWEDNVNGFLKESGLGMEALNHLKMLGRNLGGADRQMQIWSMTLFETNRITDGRDEKRYSNANESANLSWSKCRHIDYHILDITKEYLVVNEKP